MTNTTIRRHKMFHFLTHYMSEGRRKCLPAYTAFSPSSSSILKIWLYFAKRSERQGAPVLIYKYWNEMHNNVKYIMMTFSKTFDSILRLHITSFVLLGAILVPFTDYFGCLRRSSYTNFTITKVIVSFRVLWMIILRYMAR